MLELIQTRFQTVVLVVLVFMLSAVFVLQFGGPQSRGCSTMLEETGYAARVNGRTLSNGDFRAAFTVTGFNRQPARNARSMRLRELTLDGMIERELLASEAERMGFRVDEDEVMDDLLETGLLYLNPPVDAPDGYPGPTLDVSGQFRNRDGEFSARYMTSFIHNALRRSTEEFVKWQQRERLANLMRESIGASVSVSAEEIRDMYARETDRAQLDYVQFRPAYYREQIQPADADVRAWMAEHTSEVDEEYTRQRHRYTGLEPQVRARHILIKAAQDASETDRAAARARAEAILARVRGGEDFATVARTESEDEGSARRGGDLGFNPRGRMVAPFDEAQFGLEIGQISDIVESQFGFHVIKVEDRREGDVAEDVAKRELAEGLFVRARAGEMAHEQAVRALAYLRDGHTTEELDAQLLHDWNVPAPVAPEAAPAAGTEGTEAAAADEETPERDALAPQVRETRRFGRTDAPIPGPFDSGALTRAAFSMSLEAPLPEEPVQLGDDWFVFRLKDRVVATDEGLTDEIRGRIEESLLAAKRVEAVRAFVHELRDRADHQGQIRIDERVLDYGDRAEEETDSEEESPEEESALPVRRSAIPA